MSREQNKSGSEQDNPRIAEINSRQLIYGLIGAALYCLVYWLTNRFPVPALGGVIFRPAAAILVFFGIACGPWAGLLAGFIGNTVGDLLTSGDFFWNWSLGSALIGMVPGLIMIRFEDFRTFSGIFKALGWSTLSIAVGTLFASLMELFVSGIDLRTALVDYFPLAFLGNFVCAIVLLPIFMIVFASVVSRRDR